MMIATIRLCQTLAANTGSKSETLTPVIWLMSSADRYRALAADCAARASSEHTLGYGDEWRRLASSYRRLAEQAERNSRDDFAYASAEARRDRMTPKS
jgi:hypothetical protein